MLLNIPETALNRFLCYFLEAILAKWNSLKLTESLRLVFWQVQTGKGRSHMVLRKYSKSRYCICITRNYSPWPFRRMYNSSYIFWVIRWRTYSSESSWAALLINVCTHLNGTVSNTFDSALYCISHTQKVAKWCLWDRRMNRSDIVLIVDSL
jgi:hypothetical protein